MIQCPEKLPSNGDADQSHSQIPRIAHSIITFDSRPVTKILAGLMVFMSVWLVVAESTPSPVWAQEQGEAAENLDWLYEIEKVFIPSIQCKQCHDRHWEEWKGMRERSDDLLSYGRVDGALLHGTALKSPVFRTVLGLWLKHIPLKNNEPNAWRVMFQPSQSSHNTRTA